MVSARNKTTVGTVVINILMGIVCFVSLFPVWNTIAMSFSSSSAALRENIYFLPHEFTLESYKTVFQDQIIVKAFIVTILKTVIGTAVSVFFTAMVAYGMSKKQIMGNKFYLIFATITMFFGGGMIPTFVVFKNLGLFNNFLVYIIPAMFGCYNMILFMSFFRELPAGLEESARLDGANDMLIFVRIVLPLSMPVVATIALFNGVGQWNDYFTGVLYINDQELQPIQTYLYRIVASASASKAVVAMPAGISAQQVSSTTVRMATMVVTTLPIVCVYPFLQKYFVKGFLIGSIKG